VFAGLPPAAAVAGVPFHPQTELHCGPAALAMVLGWSGQAVSPAELAPAVFTPGRAGSLQHDLVAAARRHDRLAVPVSRLRDLLSELAAGHPVLVLQNLGLDWWPQWHYAVAIGYDQGAGELLLHSGLEPRRAVSLATFERTWARAGRWALVVLPPATLPASAEPATVLQAALGLEQGGRPGAAARAYTAIHARWPAALGALLGLGNARYAQGDLAGAETAFRDAVARHPEAAVAWNNLAHVLAERGERGAALDAARHALGLGGPFASTAQETLSEIQGGPLAAGRHGA
jgi:tetratricopeptide (TPR) repeat protein